VIFVVCQQGDIRLQGGSNSNEGRIEVCVANQWGSVCDDAFDVPDAAVACRQLGYRSTGERLLYSYLSGFIFHLIILVFYGGLLRSRCPDYWLYQ